MALIGRLHPLLIHFPIALVLMAAAAEGAAILTGSEHWRSVAVVNVRAGAAFGLLAAAAGWWLASLPDFEKTPLLEWHRWLGTIGATITIVSALATFRIASRRSVEPWTYRVTLFAAGLLVGLTGHLGGLLVWGPNFFHS